MARQRGEHSDPFELPLSSFRSRLLRNIGIGLVIGVVVGLLSEIQVIKNLETLVYDARLRERPTRPSTVIPPVTLVMITQQTMESSRPTQEIPLGYLSELIDALVARGPKVIGLDLLLSGHEVTDENAERLQTSIRLAGNVVLSGRALPEPTLGLKALFAPRFLTEVAQGAGLQHLNVGDFGRVRDASVRLRLSGDQKANAMSVLLAQLHEANAPPKSFSQLKDTNWSTPFAHRYPNADEVEIPINYQGPRSEVGSLNGTYPCLRATVGDIRAVDDRYIRDQIVIVGSALDFDYNRNLTPMDSDGEMWTSEVIANLTENILDGDYLWFPTRGGKILYLMVIGFIAAFVASSRRLLPVSLLMLLYTLFLVYFLRNGLYLENFVFPYVPTLLVPWLTAFGSVGARVALDDREIRLLRDVFGRSVSPAIAQELVAKIAYEREKRTTGPDASHLLSEECVSSILFLDVANFTPLSENFTPERLFVFTNELLDRLADCVFENKGSLIRYTGDGLIALFGRPIVREDHAFLACEAAMRMKEELDELNFHREQRGEPRVYIRIGINTGSMMVGLLGGRQRYDYSVLGNNVNVAARFERLNKDFGTTILVGEETVRELRDEFICRPLGSITLKGKRQQVAVYELVCRTGEHIPDWMKHFLGSYEAGYLAIRAGRFDEAITAFNQALSFKPDDLATQKLLARAEERTRTGTSLT